MVARKGAEKPQKPRPDFPLTPHNNGSWVKKIGGEIRSFGRWDDPWGAEREYKAFLINPTIDYSGGYTLRDLCNHFLAAKASLVKLKRLSQRSLDDYDKAADYLLAGIPPSTYLEELRPEHFSELIASFPESWGPVTTDNWIIRITAIINYAQPKKGNLLDRPISTGLVFQRRSAKEKAIAKVGEASKELSPEELKACLSECEGQVFGAMLWLAINCGVGNTDIAKMNPKELDLKRGWLSNHRRKTGVVRRCKLWPETVEAISKVKADGNLVFRTKYHNEWRPDAISQRWTKVREKAGVPAEGKNFYAIRHTFQTLADSCKDPVAVMRCMGHKDSSMSGVYRERIEDSRLIAVSKHVRDKLKILFEIDDK